MKRFGPPRMENALCAYKTVEQPRLWPWIYRTYKANPPHVFVRNPYYFVVGPEENQLPYIDQYVMREYFSDMGFLAAVNGELSLSGVSIDDTAWSCRSASGEGIASTTRTP